MDQNWAPYFPSSNLLCSPVNPTLINGQLYNSSRWWVSEYTCKNAPCSPTGDGQNCNATHMSTSWRTTKQTYVRPMQWETSNCERKCIWHENCKRYCCSGEATQAALGVLYDPIVFVKCVSMLMLGGGAPRGRGCIPKCWQWPSLRREVDRNTRMFSMGIWSCLIQVQTKNMVHRRTNRFQIPFSF